MNAPTVHVTVVIATRNRGAALRLALEALARLELPPDFPWELVVVDNGSTDDTCARLATFAPRLPLRVVFEPLPGLSAARNAGLAVARGSVIAFTDDDCVVDPRWLLTLWEEFTSDPELAALGGRVELYDPRDRPITIRTSRDRTVFTSPYQVSLLFVGCNIAVRRTTVDLVGEFDVRLGAGTRARSGEDTDFIYRVFRHGLKAVYVPEVVVQHNHGRRTDEQVRRLRRGYAVGRGALFCKYLLRGDRGTAARAYAELNWHVREAARELRARRFPRRIFGEYGHMLLGAIIWLCSRRTGRSAARVVIDTATITPALPASPSLPRPAAPTESSGTPLRSPS
jgi:glycosyltransferase involved in cell wall biosynthesis